VTMRRSCTDGTVVGRGGGCVIPVALQTCSRSGSSTPQAPLGPSSGLQLLTVERCSSAAVGSWLVLFPHVCCVQLLISCRVFRQNADSCKCLHCWVVQAAMCSKGTQWQVVPTDPRVDVLQVGSPAVLAAPSLERGQGG
jgi:hypothetical protein